MHFEWKARFIWRFKIWCLPEQASRIWFREISSDNQRNKATHTTCLFVMSFMASCVFVEDISIDPFQYECILNEEDDLIPLIINGALILADFPSPCNYLKCARPQDCPSLIKQIECSQYWKCEAKQSCKNNSSCWWIIMQDQFISDISCWYFQNMCIFIWEKNKNSLLSDFKYDFSSFLMEKR